MRNTMMRQFSLLLACVALSACGPAHDGSQPAGSGEAASGEAGSQPASRALAVAAPPAFAICASCHSVTPGRQGAGPSLAGVWGRKAGSLPGYPFSDALNGSGIVWNAQTLDTWLAGPIKMVPGTKMVYAIPDAEGRKAVIAYLQTLK
jgi:cytochrome c